MKSPRYTSLICLTLSSLAVGPALGGGIPPARPASASDAGCEHGSAGAHNLFCAKTKSECISNNRAFRPHEITHCTIRNDQCMRVWGTAK
ncbi:hypothetical protein [Xanthobacter sp.]|uniref:hypothetical protein n=1 Tax=Xanthobacter sp. TaxID=35809 RepID=UPI0035AE502B